MKITFLGTSHGITEKNQFCSSALVSTGGKHYLVDAGAPVLTLLKESVVLLQGHKVFMVHLREHGIHELPALVSRLADHRNVRR